MLSLQTTTNATLENATSSEGVQAMVVHLGTFKLGDTEQSNTEQGLPLSLFVPALIMALLVFGFLVLALSRVRVASVEFGHEPYLVVETTVDKAPHGSRYRHMNPEVVEVYRQGPLSNNLVVDDQLLDNQHHYTIVEQLNTDAKAVPNKNEPIGPSKQGID